MSYAKKIVKKEEPFVKCNRCGERYLTDMKRIHGDEDMQYIHFIATAQFLHKVTQDRETTHYYCVNEQHCHTVLMKQLEEQRVKTIHASLNYGPTDLYFFSNRPIPKEQCTV